MSDKELLELAAKAAGVEFQVLSGWSGPVVGSGFSRRVWDPLKNDSDALPLAVKLNMAISIHDNHCMACAQTGSMQTVRDMPTPEATRRAIVRAAAEIGKAKP